MRRLNNVGPAGAKRRYIRLCIQHLSTRPTVGLHFEQRDAPDQHAATRRRHLQEDGAGKQLQHYHATAAHALNCRRSSAVGYPLQKCSARQSAHVPDHRGPLARTPCPDVDLAARSAPLSCQPRKAKITHDKGEDKLLSHKSVSVSRATLAATGLRGYSPFTPENTAGGTNTTLY